MTKIRADLKAEWLRYSGLDSSPDRRGLRDQIASLFDIEDLTKAQADLFRMADLRLTLADLPIAASQGHEEKLMALTKKEFSRS